jgi:hypothetical protein
MKVFLVLALALAALLSSPSAHAQRDQRHLEKVRAARENSDAPIGTVTPLSPNGIPAEAKESVLKVLGISESTPEGKRILDYLVNPSKYQHAPAKEAPLVRHLRGKEGIPYPKQEEIEAWEKRTAEANLSHYEKIKSDPQFEPLENDAYDLRFKTQEMAAPELPSCKESETTSYSVETGQRGEPKKGEAVDTDLLFIRGPIPLDPDLAFGKATTVVRYTTEKGDSLSVAAAGQGVDCLPTRVRVTEKHVIYSTGLKALLNYDESSRGVMYEGIQGRINEYQ